jgi:polygalacturonase
MKHRHRTRVATVNSFTIGAILPVLFGIAGIAVPATGPAGAAGPAAKMAADPPFALPEFKPPAIPDRRFNIRDFGAAEGGEKSSTAAIRAAIESASKAGGGVVIVPQGKWLTGPIQLENNIELRIEKGAELLFSQDTADYLPAVFSRHEGIECHKLSPLIHAEGKHDIAITGQGVLNGQGKPWWGLPDQRKAGETLRDMVARGVPVEQRVFDGKQNPILRPTFVQPVNCSNVLIEGVTFLYGPFWTISPVYCRNVITRGVKIVTEGEYGHTPNGDGIDPDSCQDVLIEDCNLDTGDDCITLKSGANADGLRVNKPTENVVIRRCTMHHGHGGVTIGSETSGGVRNVWAYDCVCDGTDRGIRIKTARGRGNVVEKIYMRDIRMTNITGEAIHIDMLYSGKRLPADPVTPGTPLFRDIHFSHIVCQSCRKSGLAIRGLPESPVEGLTFEDVSLTCAAGVECTDVKDLRFVRLAVQSENWPDIRLLDAKGLTFSDLKVPDGADPVFQIVGNETRAIHVQGSDLSRVKVKVSAVDNGNENVVEFER